MIHFAFPIHPLQKGNPMPETKPTLPRFIRCDKIQDPPTLVRVKRGYVIITKPGTPYEVELSRMDTSAKLLKWVHHLSQKTWITNRHINQLVVTITRVCPQVRINYGCRQGPKTITKSANTSTIDPTSPDRKIVAHGATSRASGAIANCDETPGNRG